MGLEDMEKSLALRRQRLEQRLADRREVLWLAEDTQLDDKPFAIKMLPSILVSNKRAYRQLKYEALVAMCPTTFQRTHPLIAQAVNW